MKIAICEDERAHATLLESEIAEWGTAVHEMPDIKHYFSAEEFLMVWPEERDFDLVFIDIQMRHISGIELASIIRSKDEEMIIVFVTGVWDYVLRGYDIRALKYIIKPIKTADCIKVLDGATRQIRKWKDDYMIVRRENITTRVHYDDIIFFEIKSHYIDIVTTDGHMTYKEKMRNLEETLPTPQFFRCHRSFIVNMHHVDMIQPEKIQMDDGSILPVARARWANLNEAFLKYHVDK